VQVRGIAFCGVRTGKFAEMERFFGDVMGMTPTKRDDEMLIWQLPDGALVEVFANDEPEHQHFGTAPVVGFLVDDIKRSLTELEAAGVKLIGELTHVGDRGYAFFEGPDGNIYEITGPLTSG
jgi:catechol 2,3-dioxygenase-like lactoylglutathione lyase family enzyme